MAEEPFERLRRARQEKGFKGPAEAAEAFGWSKDTYKSHENGIRGITPKAAQRYARAFGKSSGWLLTGEGNERAMPTPEEMRLVLKYRALSPREQQMLHQMADVLGQRGEIEIEVRERPR